MEKLVFSDIHPLSEYEEERATFRQKIIALKAHRRITVGDLITMVFENRETVRFQIQEMMRAEHIEDHEKITDELTVYNNLIPEPGELSATLFIEITQADQVQPVLDQLMGIDEPKHVWLTMGDDRCGALFEAGHSSEEKLSAVHYVRFRLTPQQQRGLADSTVQVRLVIDHPHYQASTVLSRHTRLALLDDLNKSHGDG